MDETWIHHFTQESYRQSAEWTAAGESHPKWPKMQTSTGKVLASVFWDAQGILFIDYLEKGRAINSKYYIALLVCLKEEIKKNVYKWKRKSALLPRQRTMSQVDRNDVKTIWIALWNASAPNLFSRSWSPVTTGCLQTSKEWSKERDLAPMKKWYRKLRHILRPKTSHSTKKASNC